jgi:ATP-dependent Zn protease
MKLHLLISLVVLLVSASGSPFLDTDATYLTYDKFIAEVDSGTVKSVILDQFSQISGTYIVDGAERRFNSFGGTGSANDILLTRLLKQKSVAVTLKEQKERDPFWDPGIVLLVFMSIVPVVTLVLAFRINSKLARLRNEPNA